MPDENTTGRVFPSDEQRASASERLNHHGTKEFAYFVNQEPPAEPIERVVNGMPLTFDDLADYAGNWADHLAKLGWIEMGEAPKNTEIECLLRDGSTELVEWSNQDQMWLDRMGGCYDDNGTVGWRELKDYRADTLEDGRD